MKKLWEKNENCQAIDYGNRELIAYDLFSHFDYFLPYWRLYKNLSRMRLHELLEDAKRLRWEVLDLRNCGLYSLPDELGEMQDLKVLFLSNCALEVFPGAGSNNFFPVLPEALGRLSSLRVLDLYGTGITALPEAIGGMKNLEYLNLTGCEYLESLPESIGQLTNLKILGLGGTGIKALPETVGDLHSLRELSLWGTKLETLPESLGKLTKLQSLDLCGCYLKDIPYGVFRFGLPFITNDRTSMYGINLTDVTLEEGDISLFSQPRELIEAYYRNRGAEAANECKVILLGDGAAGKSSIIERIVYDRFEAGALPTDGVKMTKWSRYPDGSPLTLEREPLTLRFLDFGGQEIMHSMHRCFLTNHTVYIVVCESRDDAEIDRVAARWMETIKSFAPDCPVYLALSKADLNPNVTVNERALKTINGNYRHMIRTSAKRDGDPGIRQLTEAILGEVPGCIKKMSGNRDFLGLKNELEAMEEDYLLPDKLDERCGHFRIEPSLREDLLNWFQDLGVAYPYTSELQQVYVLNPAWLTNGIYRLILRTESGGFLRHEKIRETLGKKYAGDIDPDKTYTAQEMQFILQVMRRFEISLRVTPEAAGDGVEMIPMKMEKTPPARYDEFSKEGALHLRWEAGYLPNNLIHRLIIRKYQELDPEKEDLQEKCVWRTGGWFRSPEGEQEALAEQTDRALDVWVRGRYDARVYMDGFRQEILKILMQLNIEAKEYIFCTVDGREGKISYQSVLRQYRDKVEKIYVEDVDAYVSPQQLLHDNYADAGMEQRDFFLSYNNGHDSVKAQWIAETLRGAGYSVYYQKDDCTPGMNFLTWMEDAVTHSDSFLAVCSRAYEASDYCQMELHAAITRRHKKKTYKLLQLRVENYPDSNPLLRSEVYADLSSADEETNRTVLLNAVKTLRRP